MPGREESACPVDSIAFPYIRVVVTNRKGGISKNGEGGSQGYTYAERSMPAGTGEPDSTRFFEKAVVYASARDGMTACKYK